MRAALVFALLLGCNSRQDRRLAALESEVAGIRAELAKTAAAETPPSARPTSPPSAQPLNDIVYRFVQAVRADPVMISRASGLKLPQIVTEDGLVTDAELVAKSIRTKTVRMYGNETAQRALVGTFGVDIGNAIFYERIKNPE